MLKHFKGFKNKVKEYKDDEPFSARMSVHKVFDPQPEMILIENVQTDEGVVQFFLICSKG